MTKSKTLRKFVTSFALVLALAFSAVLLVACGAPKTYGFDESGMYCVNCEVTSKGVVMNEDTENATYGSTYFEETDKNKDWDGSTITVKFKLDVSVLENGDYTSWVLALNKLNGETYVHTEEVRVGVAKQGDTYYMNELVGIAYDDALDYDAVVTNGQAFEVEDGKVQVAISLEWAEDVLDYEFDVNGETITNQKTVVGAVGFRYLWNANANVDGVVISDLEFVEAQ